MEDQRHSFRPLRIAWVQYSPSGTTAQLRGLSARRVFARPKDQAEDPAIAGTVTRAFVAVDPMVTVGVFLTCQGRFVSTEDTKRPIWIRVFPGDDYARVRRHAPRLACRISHPLVVTNDDRHSGRVVAVGDERSVPSVGYRVSPVNLFQLRRSNRHRRKDYLFQSEDVQDGA